MTRNIWNITTSRLALAAAFATGLAASPFGLAGDDALNTAAAQTADVNADVDADVDAADADADADVDVEADADLDEDASATSADTGADFDAGVETAAEDESGEAEEFVQDPDSRIAGTGSVGISSGEQRFADPASVNIIDSADFQRYREAAESNELEEAGMALDEAADRPVTEDYVAEVNEQLGVQTSLTAEQIAEAANDEPLPY